MAGKIEARPGLEVYVNKGGTITICQGNPVEGEDIVTVHPRDVDQLITVLQKAQADAPKAAE